MNKIAILYICTGEYNYFLEGFLESFEKYFCTNSEKLYYVFTDMTPDELHNIANRVNADLNLRIVHYDMPHLPWPLPTLLRYWLFSQIEDELKKSDYIFLMNANIVCIDYVSEEDYLPCLEKGEKLTFTIHPGFANKETYYAPFERRKECRAFVDWGKEKQYVFGAMNGGVTEAYLNMISVINKWTNDDLKDGIIARVHDESYVNAYISNRQDIRLISGESYCYPEEEVGAADAFIIALDKKKYIPIDDVKKSSIILGSQKSSVERVINLIIRKFNWIRWKIKVTQK